MGFFGRKFAGAGAVPGARRLGSADLQLVLLALLAEQPAHGYELMRTKNAPADSTRLVPAWCIPH
jgi:hypothetical protein